MPAAQQLGVDITPAMEQIAGAFVTLVKHGQLRGCVGQVIPDQPLYETVMRHAIHAGLNDRRFPPVKASELDDIEFEVSVLTPPRRVASSSEITIGVHGIILNKSGCSSLFLPQVAPQQGWDLETTLAQLVTEGRTATRRLAERQRRSKSLRQSSLVNTSRSRSVRVIFARKSTAGNRLTPRRRVREGANEGSSQRSRRLCVRLASAHDAHVVTVCSTKSGVRLVLARHVRSAWRWRRRIDHEAASIRSHLGFGVLCPGGADAAVSRLPRRLRGE